jgi:alpha-mannosidase
LNWPLVTWRGRRAGDVQPPITINAPALKVQAFKLAEDGSGDVVIRLVELYGSRGTAKVQTGFPIQSATSCDLLERPQNKITLADEQTIELGYSPYQLRTIRLKHTR